MPRDLAAEMASKSTAAGSPPWRVLIISTPERAAQTSSCSIAAARKVSAAQSSTVRPWPRDQAASLPLVVVFPVPLTPTRNVTLGGAAGVATGCWGVSRMDLICALSSSRNSAPPSMACRFARSRRASMISVVVCTPRSLVMSADSSSSRSPSSTVRVMATMPSIFWLNDWRVRVTACFIRLKKFFFSPPCSGSSGFSGSSFRLPKRLIKDIQVQSSAIGHHLLHANVDINYIRGVARFYLHTLARPRLVRSQWQGSFLNPKHSGRYQHPHGRRRSIDEFCSRSRRHAQRRLHHGIRRQARQVDGFRAALRGLGNLSLERLSG